MGEVELQGGYGDIAFLDRLQIGAVIEGVLDLVEPEPEIAVAARVAAFDDGAARIVVETLPDDADALDRLGCDCGEVDVDQRALGHRRVQQGREHLGPPFARRAERHIIAHAFAGIDLAERDRAHPCQRALDGGGDGAGIGDVVGQVCPAVDAREDQIGGRGHDGAERHHHRVGRRAGDGKTPLSELLQADRAGEGERMACARLLLGRGADPDIVGELACDVLQHLEAGGVDAVVIGEEDSHQVSGSSFVNPPI